MAKETYATKAGQAAVNKKAKATVSKGLKKHKKAVADKARKNWK